MKILTIDLETGGKTPGVHGITEIGACIAALTGLSSNAELNVVAAKSWLVSPIEGMQYESEALAVQGMTLDVLRVKGVPLTSAINSLRQLVKSTFGDHWQAVPWAHNADFDHAFLMDAVQRTNTMKPFGHTMLCSREFMMGLRYAGLPQSSSASLDCVMDVLGVKLPEAERHTGVGDAKALAVSVAKMLRWVSCKDFDVKVVQS